MTAPSLEEKLAEAGFATVCPAALIVRDGRLLVGLRHYASGGLWTTPGGRCEPGETIGMTLVRETAEEVGIRDLTVAAYLGDVAGARTGDTVPCFVCRTEAEPTLMEPDKFSLWRWAPLADIPRPFINDDAIALLGAWLDENSHV